MTEKYFSERRSCRLFNAEEPDFNTIEEIIIKACKAPTCGNMQLYSVIVTKASEMKTKLAALHYNQPASQAPLILTICADFNRFTKWCESKGAKSGFNNFHSFLTAVTDAVILAQQIVTIAEMKGFGTCYLGTVTYNAQEISQLLNLPDLVVPVASLAIGIPSEAGEETNRIPLKGIIHNELYKDYTSEEIKEIYSVHDNDKNNEKFIQENKKENIAQVFAEVRYPKEMNEALSEKFMKLLKDKGFINN